MKESKSELYIVAMVGIVAVVAIIVILAGGSKAKTTHTIPQNAAGAAFRSYDLGACHYSDGTSSGCPCTNPSDGVLSIGATLVESSCK